MFQNIFPQNLLILWITIREQEKYKKTDKILGRNREISGNYDEPEKTVLNIALLSGYFLPGWTISLFKKRKDSTGKFQSRLKTAQTFIYQGLRPLLAI